MYSTGVEALDSRLGGIARGGLFLVLGESGVGKSVLGTHFLIDGLDHRERCMLVTPDSKEEVDARGLYMGFSPGPLSQHPSMDVVNGRIAAESLSGAPHRTPLVEALKRRAAEYDGPVKRLLIDDINALLWGDHAPAATIRALLNFLNENEITAYIAVDTADAATPEDSVMDPLTAAADAVLVLQQAGRGRRRLSFRTIRQSSFSTDPFLYTLRSGGGFAEDLPAYDRTVDEALRKRIVILDEVDVLPTEVVTALSGKFEIEIFRDLNASLGQLLEARYGVLVLGTDPYDPERTFNLAYSLRKAGNGAPILFISHSKGLRSTTRARALRIGGDDFLIAELPPQEIVERIAITAERGHHRRNGSVRPDRPMQPKTDDGELRPMTAHEMAEAVTELVDEVPTPFFALAVFQPEPDAAGNELWDALGPQVRLGDGDLLAILPDDRVAVVLSQVDLALSRRVMARLRRAHPAVGTGRQPDILTSPLQADELRSWVAELQLRRVAS